MDQIDLDGRQVEVFEMSLQLLLQVELIVFTRCFDTLKSLFQGALRETSKVL